MGKAFALTVALLVLAAAGMCLAYGDVYQPHDQVVLTENVLYGDKTQAEGLTVAYSSTYDNRLFWDTTYVVGETPAMDTAYTFYASGHDTQAPQHFDGVLLESYVEYGWDFDSQQEQTGLARAYKELYEATALGEESTRVVYLKDYMEYYPIGATLDLPGTQLSWSSYYYETDLADPEPGTERYVIQAFQEFFQIPVLEEEQIEISVAKAGNGVSWGSGSTESDSFYVMTQSVLTEAACYFTFGSHTQQGNLVDTSRIPGGYGVYCLPYFDGATQNGRICGAKADELAMVYPLDPAVETLYLGVNKDQTKLLLHTRENGKYTVTVIEIATMTALQKLELMEWPKDESGFFVYEGEDYFAAVLCWDQLAVVACNKEGEYDWRFAVPIGNEEATDINLEPEAVTEYDGQKLVVVNFLRDERRRLETCGFYLAVYDAAGLSYFGEYKSSLNAEYGNESYFRRCLPVVNTPLRVHWGA